MKKMRMFCLFVFLFFIGYHCAFADVMCRYTVGFNIVNAKDNPCSADTVQYIDISLDDNGYSVTVPQACNYGGCEVCTSTKTYNIGKELSSFETNGYMVFPEDGVVLNELKAGKCPKTAYLDLYGARANATTEIQACFGSKEECNLLSKDFGFETKFGKHTFTGSIMVNQTNAELTGNRPEMIANGCQTKAETAIENKYKVMTDKPYEENMYCQQLASDVDGLLASIKKDYDNQFEAARKYYYDTKKYSDFVRGKYNIHVEQYKTASDSLPTTIANNLRTACANIIQGSEKTDTEKSEITSQFDVGFTELVKGLSEYFTDPYQIDIGVNPGDFVGNGGCEGFLGNPDNIGTPAYFLELIMNIIKYLGIIICLLFSIIDFVKAVTSQDQDLLKKAIGVSVKRLVYAIVIFFLPIIINFILGLIGAYSTCL